MFRRTVHAGGAVVRFEMARRLVGPALKVTSAYRVGPFLVDCGPSCRAGDLRRALRGEGVAGVLLTHGHEDHAGNVGALRGVRAVGAAGLRLERGVPFYRRLAWGEPRVAPVEAAEGGVDAAGVELRPVPTPGHTPDHLAWWAPDPGWVFAGDAVLGPIRLAKRGEDIASYIASLRALRDLRPEVVFPAHGPVLHDAPAQLEAQARHVEGLRDAARALAREGLPPRAIAARLLGRADPMGWLSRGEFSKLALVEALLA